MIKNDKWIKEQAAKGMITPFEPSLVRKIPDKNSIFNIGDSNYRTFKKVISYGLSSYGYDLRLSATDFRIFRHIPGTIVNPKAFNPANLEQAELHKDEYGEFFVIPANSYGLGVAVERLEIPENITVLFIGKSTYARCGLLANLTPGEASWKGYLTLEISNASSADCRVYANEGIVQALFLEGEPCETTYEDRKGKYQDQGNTVTLAKV